MTTIKEYSNYFLHSYKRFGMLLLIITAVITVPFTIGVYSQQQSSGSLDDEVEIAQDASNPIEDVSIQSGIVNCTVADSDLAMNPDEQEMVSLINQFRSQNGLGDLPLSQSLTRAAAWMAKDMITNNNLNTHTDSLGRSYAARIGNCGFPSPATAVDILLANSGNPPASSLQAWTNSPSHKPVILNSVSGITRTWQSMGVAKAGGGQSPFTTRWVVAFGEANDGGAIPTTAPTITQPPITQPPITQPPATITISPPASITPSITIIPGSTISANVSFKLPGVGLGLSNNNQPLISHKIYGQLILLEGEQSVQSAWTQFDYNTTTGIFSSVVPISSTGNLVVKIRSNGSLIKSLGIINFASNQTNQIQANSLTTGDLNGDNVLNLIDYNILISCYGSKQCIPQGKEISDLNLDGKVNQLDLNIFYFGLANREGD